MDSEGNVSQQIALVKEMGFDVGSRILRKQDKCQAVITAMNDDKVTLEVEDGPISGSAQVSAASFRKGEWKLYKGKVEPPLELPNCCDHSALKSQEMQIQLVRGKVFQELFKAEQKHAAVLKHIKMQIKPHREVKANQLFNPGKLLLVPCTFKLETRGTPAAGSIPLGKIKGIKVALCPCYQGPDKDGCMDEAFLQPFWFVKPTHDPDKVNMELTTIFGPDDANDSCSIPLLRNTKDVYVDDVLMRYVAKEKKQVEVEPLAPIAKRQRMKGPATPGQDNK